MSGAASLNKPPYRIPSVSEIAELPWNGFSVASTFSGCGGSSLGYRLAGFRVLWANEFVDAARASYEANKSPATIVDGRDIRSIDPNEVLDAIGLAAGELDLLDGSPPCASFSTAGKRERDWGKVKNYSDTKQRTDDLFYEFIRLLKGIQPKVFIAENVSGLVKGTAKGYFLRILAALKDAGYRVEARLLDAQWLGVPQARQRLIFQGVRADLGIAPAFPKPLQYRYSVRDALPNILQQGDNAGFGRGSLRPAEQPSPTIGAGPTTGNGRFPPSMVVALEDANGYSKHAFYSTDRPADTIQATRPVKVIATKKGPRSLDEPAPTVLTHGREHTNNELMVEAETDISRFSIGAEWDKMQPGEKSERYFQLQKPALDGPCPTVTFGAGALSCAGVVHPTEKRRFSIAELRRICAFPDDFVLTGTYSQQWERLGRAVPPVMMAAIAAAVRDGVLKKLG